MLEQGTSFPESLLFLAGVIPVPVTEHKVSLAGQGKKRDFVEYCFDPETLDEIFEITLIVVTTSVIQWFECDVDLLGWLELEGRQVFQVCVVEVRAFRLQKFNLIRRDSDIRNS